MIQEATRDLNDESVVLVQGAQPGLIEVEIERETRPLQ